MHAHMCPIMERIIFSQVYTYTHRNTTVAPAPHTLANGKDRLSPSLGYTHTPIHTNTTLESCCLVIILALEVGGRTMMLLLLFNVKNIFRSQGND